MEAGTETLSSIAQREDFLATGDPALQESADRGRFELLGYSQLYELWERQQWATQDLDFTQDRIDWHERISAEERYTRMYGLSAFFIGEQRVTDELGPIMRAAPTEDMRIFLSTQIADEARHVRFFNRFYEEVGVLKGADDLAARLARVERNLNPEFAMLFDEMLRSRVDRLASEPEDLEVLVEAITIYHMVIEGVLALTGQHFIIGYNEEQGTLPGFVEGFGHRRPRRAPPRRLRGQVPDGHGERRRALPPGDPAHPGRVAARRRGRPAAAVRARGRRRLRALRRLDARDAGLRRPVSDQAAEGDRSVYLTAQERRPIAGYYGSGLTIGLSFPPPIGHC